MQAARAIVLCLPVLAGTLQPALAEKPRLEYRVVYAPARDLGRRLEAAGREGYACVGVARPDPGAAPPGVVVLLGRAADGAPSAVAHRVVVGGWAGTDLEAPLEKAGAEGFRLCGVVLDEEPPNAALVAVMSRADPQAPVHYGVEVLTNYKDSLVRLNARAGEGFLPVAAAPVNNSRVPEMRAWMVVIERAGAGAGPRDVAVRSNSGPEGFQKALNEQGGQGYRVDLIWKEGNDAVAMMSRPRGSSKDSHAYTVDAAAFPKIHSISRLYVADVAYRSDERLVVSDRGMSASNDVEEDPLPPLSKLGTSDAEALEVLGNHLSRHGGFVPVSARVRRGPGGTFVLATVLTQRGP